MMFTDVIHYPPHNVMCLCIKYSYKMKAHVILPIPHLE